MALSPWERNANDVCIDFAPLWRGEDSHFAAAILRGEENGGLNAALSHSDMEREDVRRG